MSFFDFIKANKKFLPSSTYFDNLYSEYRSLNPPVPAGPDRDLLDSIYAHRHERSLRREDKFSWDDIYTFDLTLLNYLPIDKLRNKVVALRDMYLNIFGQEKYKTYLDSAPPDLAAATINDLQRDAQFLLHQIYLSLGALSSRDGLGKSLTLWAAYMLIAAAVLLFILYKWKGALPSMPFAVALCAGAAGGLMSILHRLQAIPTEGDPIYGLAVFWHGSYALFVSPLTGAIFGVLLYLAIAGGILEGRFFPKIATPRGDATGTECGQLITASDLMPKATPSPGPSQSPSPGGPTPRGTASPSASASPGATTSPAPTASPVSTASPSPVAGSSPSISPSPSASPSPAINPSPTVGAGPSPARTANSNTTPTPSPSPSPSIEPTQAGRVSINQFLNCSSPETGVDYALLIIWCFLAGFAERLVPDTLNRLVDENDTTQVKKQ